MAKVVLVLATQDVPQPAGARFGGSYLFKLGDAASISSTPTASFDGVADGSYTMICQSLDATGAPIADQVSGSVVVLTPVGGTPPSPAPAPAPDTYPAPLSLTATVTY